jgi:hypothetical protein
MFFRRAGQDYVREEVMGVEKQRIRFHLYLRWQSVELFEGSKNQRREL